MKFIGIVGPSGSGKTSLCEALKNESKDIECIHLDNYFNEPSTFPKIKGFTNWEDSSNINFERLLEHLKILTEGELVKTKSFPKKAGGLSEDIVLEPKKYVLVEGFLALSEKQLREYFDLTIFLDIPKNKLLERRALRFGQENINKYDVEVAIPEYLKQGIKQKKHAEYIIDATQSQSDVMEQVRNIIKNRNHD